MMIADRGYGVRAFDYLVGEAARQGRKVEPELWDILVENAGRSLWAVALLAHFQGEAEVSVAAVAKMNEMDQAGHYVAVRNRAGLADLAAKDIPFAKVSLIILLKKEGDIEGILGIAGIGDVTTASMACYSLIELGAKEALLRLPHRVDLSAQEIAALLFLVVKYFVEQADSDALSRLGAEFPIVNAWLEVW